MWFARTGALGDFITTLPTLDALVDQGHELVLIAPLRYRALWDRAARWIDPEGAELASVLAGRVALRHVHLAVSASPTLRAALGAAGAQQVLALEAFPKEPAYDHAWRVVGGALGWGPRNRGARLVPDDDAAARIARRVGATRPVVISPGSGGATKRWPITRWNALAAARHDVVWVGGPVESAEPGWGVPRWDDLDLADLVALAARCRAWFAPDSGPAHLAAAAGARTGVLFLATDPLVWAPPGATLFHDHSSLYSLLTFADGADG